MNELILLLQVSVLLVAVLGALRLGSHALIAFISLCGILANVFVLKQVQLFGMLVTTSDAFLVGSILGLNLLQEYYGKAMARKAIYTSFAAVIFYTIISQVQLAFAPAVYDTAHLHYAALLTPMPRILLASIFVYVFVQHLDYLLYGLMKRVLRARFLVVRNMSSLCVTQLIDTVLFSFLGLYGLVASVGSIILFSYCMKMIIIFLSAPCIALSRYIMNMHFDSGAVRTATPAKWQHDIKPHQDSNELNR